MSEGDATPKERLGRYELLGSLGSGGMGDVHRARAYGAAGTVKELCIKRIRPSRLSDAGAVARFVSEARLSMRLSHNNIVPVFDFGRADGQYFLAMEWVDGSDLRSLLRAGRLPPCVAGHVAAEVARALDYAHALPESAGGPLIHRDIKPANVLISCAGDVKLVDFGVAVAGCMDTDGRSGTLAYMAPEQARGESVDARADLFALGVVLAEMLGLGRPRRPEDLPDETPPAMASVLRRLLAENREARPSSAKAVASELEDLVAHRRIAGDEAPRDSLRERVESKRISDPDLGDPEVWAADLSYLRDGDGVTLGSMLGATHSTADDDGSASRVREPPSQAATPNAAQVLKTDGRARFIGPALVLLLLGMGAASIFRPWRAEPVSPSTSTLAGSALEVARSEPAVDVVAPTEVPSTPSHGTPSPANTLPAPTAPGPTAHGRARARTLPHVTQARPATAPGHSEPVGPASPGAPDPAAANEALAPARVDINATPWARVIVDGRDLGTTPLFDLSLPPGRHQLRLDNPPLGRSRSMPLELEAASHRRVVVDMLEDDAPTPSMTSATQTE